MWQIVANLEFVTGFAIDLQTRKPNISPRVTLNQSISSQKGKEENFTSWNRGINVNTYGHRV